MRLPFLLSAAVLALVVPAPSQELASQELQGPVRSVSIETTIYQNQAGHLAEAKIAPRLMRFDQRGFLIEDTTYNQDGSVQNQTLFVRDGAKMLDVKRYEPGETLRSHEVRTFDENGGMLSLITYGANGEVLCRAEAMEETYYKPDGSVHKVVKHNQEEDGTAEIVRLRNDATVEQRVAIKMESGGKLHQTIYNGAGKPTSEAFELRRNGFRVRQETNMGPNGKPSTSSYVFNDTGRLLEITIGAGEGYRKFVHSYDRKGRLSSTSAFDRNGRLQERTTLEYESDALGNWTRRSTYKWTPRSAEPRLESVTTRTISYE